MSDGVLALKLLHILGATVLLGTGLGIAFFMWMAHRTGEIAHTSGIVMIADFVFTERVQQKWTPVLRPNAL